MSPQTVPGIVDPGSERAKGWAGMSSQTRNLRQCAVDLQSLHGGCLTRTGCDVVACLQKAADTIDHLTARNLLLSQELGKAHLGRHGPGAGGEGQV
jgi:hypothetical protein